MSNVLKVMPEEIRETCCELKQLSLETQKIVDQFHFLMDKMQSQWEGSSQQAFNDSACYAIRHMERFALLCEEYSEDMMQIATCYMKAESMLANNINSVLPSTFI